MAKRQFANVPQNLQSKMERCVQDLKADPKFKPRPGRTRKQAAIAVCFASVVGGKDLDELIEKEVEMNAAQRRKKRRREERRLELVLKKQADGEELTHEDLMLIAKNTEADDNTVSQDQAAAEIAAAIAGTSEDPIEIDNDTGDLMKFERNKESLEKDEEDEKKHYDVPDSSSVHIDLPAKGATTFDELDEYREAMDEAHDIRSVIFDFEMLVDNVIQKSEPGELGDKIVALGAEMKGRLEDPPDRKEIGIIERIKAKLTRAAAKRIDISQPAKKKSSGIEVQKALDGTFRWFGWVSNKWRDRDYPAEPKIGGQIITEAAHKEFVEWAWKNPAENMPYLWPWHTPISAHKDRADWVDYADGFLLASGSLTKDEAKRLEDLSKNYDLAMSHGLVNMAYDKENGYIEKYRTFEVSYLPRDHAANEWTDIDTITKEVAEMGFTPKRRQFLVDAVGEDTVSEKEEETEGKAKALENLDVEFKDVLETLERIAENGDGEEPGDDGPTEARGKEFDYGKLNEFLEVQQKAIDSHGKAIETIADAVIQLTKSDDQKVAEKLRPRVDVEKDTTPIWERSLSKSTETELDEEEDKDLSDSKPEVKEPHWLVDALGAPVDEAAVPR